MNKKFLFHFAALTGLGFSLLMTCFFAPPAVGQPSPSSVAELTDHDELVKVAIQNNFLYRALIRKLLLKKGGIQHYLDDSNGAFFRNFPGFGYVRDQYQYAIGTCPEGDFTENAAACYLLQYRYLPFYQAVRFSYFEKLYVSQSATGSYTSLGGNLILSKLPENDAAQFRTRADSATFVTPTPPRRSDQALGHAQKIALLQNAILQNIIFTRIAESKLNLPDQPLSSSQIKQHLSAVRIPTFREKLYGLTDIVPPRPGTTLWKKWINQLSPSGLKTYNANKTIVQLGGLELYVFRRFNHRETYVTDLAHHLPEPGTLPPPLLPEQIGHVQEVEDQDYRLYLVGMDEDKGAIYFFSGEDISLSDVSRLYAPYGTDLASMAKWPVPIVLEYMSDRLFAYRVGPLSSENIIRQDAEALVVLTDGFTRGQACRVEATLHFNDPDKLAITIR